MKVLGREADTRIYKKMVHANDATDPRSNTENATHLTTCESELKCLGSGKKIDSVKHQNTSH